MVVGQSTGVTEEMRRDTGRVTVVQFMRDTLSHRKEYKYCTKDHESFEIFILSRKILKFILNLSFCCIVKNELERSKKGQETHLEVYCRSLGERLVA